MWDASSQATMSVFISAGECLLASEQWCIKPAFYPPGSTGGGFVEEYEGSSLPLHHCVEIGPFFVFGPVFLFASRRLARSPLALILV